MPGAGPDDRAPLSYDVDTSEFIGAVQHPNVAGWRVAWSPDLNGLIPVDADVARVAEGSMGVFATLGAHVAGGVAHERAQRALDVERTVLVVAVVLDRQLRLAHDRCDLVEGDRDAAPSSVVEHRTSDEATPPAE